MMPHATLAKDAKEFYSRRAAEIVELSSHVPQLRDALSRAKVAKDSFSRRAAEIVELSSHVPQLRDALSRAKVAKDAKEFYSRRAAEIVELSSHVPQLRDALSRAKVAKDAKEFYRAEPASPRLRRPRDANWILALLRSVSASSLSFAGFTDSEVMKLMGGLRQHEPHTT